MRYYQKHHAIELGLTDLFPKVEDKSLVDEMKEYYQSIGQSYDDIEMQREKEKAEQFHRHKELLMEYAPDKL